eukprot:TRINITY_DN18454_c0_g1_i1.p1 TRINITY_DN18454_c0_g1~~TRINITY_DN18454_c0_g1_i1.p1  ORF type:complete len:321 (-),score=89.54 TRINITY_DN18454_c0_g1_i1:470-1432(-)
MAANSALLVRQSVQAFSLASTAVNSRSTTAAALQTPGRHGAHMFPARLSSVTSTFQGSMCGFDKAVNLGSAKKPAGVCMAWGGSLASVRLIIQGKHMDLTDSIKAYIEEKIGKAVEKHVQLVREVDVRLSTRGGDHALSHQGHQKGKPTQRAEVTIYTKKHGIVRAEEDSERAYSSIDLVADVVERKLRKIKEKDGGNGRNWQMRHKPNVEELLPAVSVSSVPDLDFDEAELSDQEGSPEQKSLLGEIVRTKRYSIPPMTTESAMDELLNVGHDFFAFRSIETGDVNILYRRRSGGFGLIIPREDEPWEQFTPGVAQASK